MESETFTLSDANKSIYKQLISIQNFEICSSKQSVYYCQPVIARKFIEVDNTIFLYGSWEFAL
jgi:uncharacterized pyridoxamine 5'-phosphate oxidase family protein